MEGADYSVVITGVRRTPISAAPPQEIHTTLPVTHGGNGCTATVECVCFCVCFCETEGVAFAIPLYYNGVMDYVRSRQLRTA